MLINTKEELDSLHMNGLLRTLCSAESEAGRMIVINSREYINYASNNYLGLANHPGVKQAAIDAVKRFGTGSTASRLIAGNLLIHEELERALAELKHTSSALVFPTGYQTSIGIITACVGRGDIVLIDRLCHASLVDAVRISGAQLLVYPHNDPSALERIIRRSKPNIQKLIVTDGVFSMDGDIAPLKELSRTARQYDAVLLVDDAHGTGVLGPTGSGSVEQSGIDHENLISMGTLSKALASQGGFVCGDRNLRSFFINKARSFIYTTGLNPAACGAALKAVEIIRTESGRRHRLIQRADTLRYKLGQMGFDTGNSQTPIIPVIIGDTAETVALAGLLFEHGIYCPAIRPPTVKKGSARLRISVTAEHTDQDIDALVSVFKEHA
ncbi:MAG: 8-amino-7-oxononanoate synthase [Elusimicrobia bacterium]|nr:8-amino-7-oxononanoate synthase [Elusimicrobiota bacterium]MBD3411499.1 8-amino-7-oxononanoate synthase [Elusimicrobiota bacterium]